MAVVVSRFQHDEAVRLCALRMLSEGYEVRARVEGWFQSPDYINGYRPDVVASRDNVFIIVEVQKGDIDWPKISAFTRLENEKPNFRVRIISPEQVMAGIAL